MAIDAVSHPEAKTAKRNPQYKPEQVERHAEDHGIDSIPQRNGKTHAEERKRA